MAIDLIGAVANGSVGDGWSRLGQALGGLTGDPSTSSGYLKGLDQGVGIQRKMLEARKLRDQSMARERIQGSIYDYVQDPKIAALISDAFLAGDNLQQASAGFGNLQEQGYQREAMDAARNFNDPNSLDLINRINMVIQGKPVDLTKVEGNTVFNPMISAGAQDPEITDYGEGMLENTRQRNAASADIARARLADSRARASDRQFRADERERASLAKRTLNDAAESMYREARAAGTLPKGVTKEDIRYQLQTTGEWKGPDGKVLGRYSVNLDELTGNAAPEEPADLVDAMDPRRYGGGPRATEPGGPEAAAALDRAERARPITAPPTVLDPVSPQAAADVNAIDLYEAAQRRVYGDTGADRYGRTAAAPAAAPAPAAAAGEPLPAAAAARLREGVQTTFANGQTWTLRNGQPVRVK